MYQFMSDFTGIVSAIGGDTKDRDLRDHRKLDQAGRIISLTPTASGLGQRSDASVGPIANVPQPVALFAGGESEKGFRNKKSGIGTLQ
jgi:hypothetical protein